MVQIHRQLPTTVSMWVNDSHHEHRPSHFAMNTPPFSANPLQPPLPSIVGYPVPSLPPLTARPSDLSAISRGRLELPPDHVGFVPSLLLQDDVRRVSETPERLHARIIDEAERYAEDRKALVRTELKRRQNTAGVALTPIDKGKLRSRREAKVHNVKKREFERALKDTIRWLIDERAAQNLVP